MAIPVLILLAFGPYWSWCLLLGLAAGVGLWEYQRMVLPSELPQHWRFGYILLGLVFPSAAAMGGATGLHSALVFCLFAGFLTLLFFSPQDSQGIAKLSRLSLGWLYIPYLLSYVLLIGQADQGRPWIFFTLIVIVASDAGAFYTGKRLGQHKLYERVSPKKTLEGSAGGLLASLLFGTLFGILFIGTASIGEFLFLSGFLAIVGQLGDLVESLMKRLYGKKDSSNLLPGHGGLLDRLDSLFFAFPATWFFLQWLDQGLP